MCYPLIFSGSSHTRYKKGLATAFDFLFSVFSRRVRCVPRVTSATPPSRMTHTVATVFRTLRCAPRAITVPMALNTVRSMDAQLERTVTRLSLWLPVIVHRVEAACIVDSKGCRGPLVTALKVRRYDRILQDIIDDMSTFDQVMAWCHQVPSHYLIQFCPGS